VMRLGIAEGWVWSRLRYVATGDTPELHSSLDWKGIRFNFTVLVYRNMILYFIWQVTA